MQESLSGPQWREAVARCTAHLGSVGVKLDDKRVLLAVSGGMDSMCMLALLTSMKAHLSVAHVNYGLRGADSDADAALVREYCAVKGITVFEKKLDLKAMMSEGVESLQQLGRRLRYTWFEELRTIHELDYICTAHHQDDAAESFFINLLRGTGLKGLSGIPVLRGKIIRPMLCFTRAEISTLVNIHQIPYRDDASNLGRAYLRNRIRQDIIPALQTERRYFITRMHSTQERLRAEYMLMEDYMLTLKAELCTEDRGMLMIDRVQLLATRSPAVVLLFFIQEYGFSWTQCQHIVAPVQSTGATYLSSTHRLIVDRKRIYVASHPVQTEEEVFRLDRDGDYFLPDGELSITHQTVPSSFSEDPFTEYINASRLSGILTVRHWRAGDYFYPLGGPGKQKLQDFFTNQKLSPLDKENLWLLVSGEEIVWVIGMRLDDRYKIDPATTESIRVQWKPGEA